MPLLDELREIGFDPGMVSAAAAEEVARRQTAAALLADPFAFHRDIVCLPRLRPLLAPLHASGLEWINEDTGRYKLILWPRGHLKTTLFTQGETLRLALIDPDQRFLINTAKWDNSKRFLSAIKGVMQSPRFVEVFGDLLPPPNSKYHKNNEAELTLVSRTNLSLREPTWSTSGVDKTQTSQHYDHIVHDDLVTRENISSPDLMDKVILNYKDSLDLLEPDGHLWMLGTRWHTLDLYGWVLDSLVDARCKEQDFRHVERCECLFDVTFETVEEEGVFIFPKKFNAQKLAQLRIQKGDYEVSSQYYNNPTDPSACWFRQSEVKRAEVSPEEVDEVRSQLVWYVTIDPAESVEKRASFTATVAVGIDPRDGVWWVDFAKQAKVLTDGFIALGMDTWKRYRPHRFGMETNTRKALAWALRDKQAEYGVAFDVIDLKPTIVGPGKEQKERRIRRLQNLFGGGKIRISTACTDLLKQLYTLPSATSWDLADALAYVLDLAPAGQGHEPLAVAKRRRYVHWKRVGY